ncbi:hypothetical protein H0H81_010331, partial [Sphagnurus paluster]
YPANDVAWRIHCWPSKGFKQTKRVDFKIPYPTLLDLIVVECTHENKSGYDLLNGQCYWFTAAVSSVLADIHGGVNSKRKAATDLVPTTAAGTYVGIPIQNQYPKEAPVEEKKKEIRKKLQEAAEKSEKAQRHDEQERENEELRRQLSQALWFGGVHANQL